MLGLTVRTKVLASLVLALVAILGLGWHGSETYRIAVNETLASTKEASQAVATALRAQVHFKKQVQEWKNVLLRGQEPQLYRRYLGQFQREEQATREGILELIRLLADDSHGRRLAMDFLHAHKELGVLYRQGLQTYLTTSVDPHLATDRQVRGIDRAPTDLLDDVVSLAKQRRERVIEATQLTLLDTERRLALIHAVIALLVLTVVAWLLNHTIWRPIAAATRVAQRISKGDLQGNIQDSRRDDETGQLMRALKVMQDNLSLNQEELDQRNDSLVKARDEALEAVRTKGQFLANMSHELRTPLNGVLGMLDLLRASPLSQEQREYAEIAHCSGEMLLALINDVLDYSKLEAGKVRLESLRFDLRSHLDEVVRAQAGRAHQKGLEIVALVDANVPQEVRGDPTRLRQILTNLVGNAVKFTEQGEIIIRISSAKGRDGEAVELRFQVEDSGIGIDARAQDAIFESFTQADGSTTRQYGGTGLGLAISRELVELMGGRIGVESSKGAGSTFWFTVEMIQEASTAPAFKADAHLRGLRVLLVDDNRVNRLVFQDMMDRWGICHSSAESGPLGLHMIRRAQKEDRPFQVIVLDMQMPGLSGLEVAKDIRSDALLDQPRMILLTSQAQPGDAEEARRAGVQAYLPKPVNFKALHDCLVSVLDQDPGEQEPFITRHRLAEEDMRRREHILLVEDNPVNQKVALSMLKKLGYQTDVAADGRQALEAGERHRYDLVLMDVQMPVLDGLKATLAWRDREAGNGTEGADRVPIVAMTANVMEGDREKCLSAGMDDYLAKPVRRKALQDKLDLWLKGKQTPPAAEEGSRQHLRSLQG